MPLVEEIGGILVGMFFGSTLLAGLFLLLFMSILGVVMRFTLDCWVATMVPLGYILFFHPEMRLLPGWLWIVAAILLGILIGRAIFKMIRS